VNTTERHTLAYPARSDRTELAAAMQEALAVEARRNEFRVAVVRLAAYGLVSVLDIVLFLRGLRPARMIADSAVFVLVSVSLLGTIAKLPYSRIYWLVVPTADFLLIDHLLRGRIVTMGINLALSAVCALACGLFAATGGLRFDRRAAAWTTFLAVVLLYRLLGAHTSNWYLLYSAVTIASIGLLNFWLVDQVRRAMEATRGQLLLERLLPGVADAALKDPVCDAHRHGSARFYRALGANGPRRRVRAPQSLARRPVRGRPRVWRNRR
jgi:hypothetical protein